MCELCALVQQWAVPGIRRRWQAGYGVEESCVCIHTYSQTQNVQIQKRHLLLQSSLDELKSNIVFFGSISWLLSPQKVFSIEMKCLRFVLFLFRTFRAGVLVVTRCVYLCRFIGPSTVFGSSSKLANVEQWRCVTILRNHTGGNHTGDSGGRAGRPLTGWPDLPANRKVGGSISPVEVSKCGCVLGRDTEPQTAPDVIDKVLYVNEPIQWSKRLKERYISAVPLHKTKLNRCTHTTHPQNAQTCRITL